MAIVLETGYAVAAPLAIGLSVHGPETKLAPNSLASVTATSVAGGAPHAKVTGWFNVPSEGILDVPQGTWRISIDLPGFFADAQTIVIGTGEPRPVTFALWPTGFIEGTYATEDKARVQKMLVRWFSSRDAPADSVPESFSVCDVDEKHWRCEVAAGKIDVRIHTPPYMSEIRTGLVIEPSKTVALGTFSFRRGASLTGRVTMVAPGVLDLKSARVWLLPSNVTRPSEMAKSGFSATLQRNGTFEIRGLPPGEYQVVARQDKMSSAIVPVIIRKNAEAELREALVLALPRTLAVTIAPPLQISGERWRVRIARFSAAHHTDVVFEGNADEAGMVRWEGMRPGSYRIEVGPPGVGTFAARTIQATGADVAETIVISQVHVQGTVKLGGKPLPGATIFLGGAHQLIAAPLRTDSAGEFAGFVPPQETESWVVSVNSEKPPVDRTVEQKPSRIPETGDLRLDIDLGSGTLGGVVVDEDGAVVDRVVVNVRSPSPIEDVIQQPVERGGTFLFTGVAAGSYQVHAWTFDQRESDRVTAVVGEDGASDSVRLVVHKQGELKGRVISNGGPVAGARVFVHPTDVPQPVLEVPATTSADGTFRATVAPGAQEANIAIAAPGFSIKTGHLPLTGAALTFAIDSLGGVLDVDVPDFAEDYTTPQAFLVHRDAEWPVRFFVSLASAAVRETTAGRVHATIPMMEPGDYALCTASFAERAFLRSQAAGQSRCVYGTLAPYGALSLTAPPSTR